MLMQEEPVTKGTGRNVQGPDIFRRAFYPITLPQTVGPGSISVAITSGANSTHVYGFHIRAILSAVSAIFLIAASIAVCYRFATRLARTLGETGMVVITRLSAFLLVCIGVRIMWNGTSELLSSLRFHVH